MTVERWNPPGLAPPVDGVYAQLARGRAGDLVAIAGQVALDPDGVLVGPGNLAAQAEQAFRNLAAALAAAGCGPEDLLKYTVHVVGHRPELVEVVFAAGRRVFGDRWPRTASTLLGVQALGRPEWLIEIDGFALAPGSPVRENH